MEAEARAILRQSLADTAPQPGFGTWVHDRFAGLGLDEVELPSRTGQATIGGPPTGRDVGTPDDRTPDDRTPDHLSPDHLSELRRTG